MRKGNSKVSVDDARRLRQQLLEYKVRFPSDDEAAQVAAVLDEGVWLSELQDAVGVATLQEVVPPERVFLNVTCLESTAVPRGVQMVVVEDCECAHGYEYAEGRCQLCPMGFFKDYVQDAICDRCPDGRTTAAVGSVRAEDCVCDVGTFDVGEATCSLCSEGMYCDLEGAHMCPPLTTTREGEVGADGKDDCLCTPGHTLAAGSGQCIPCEPGSYKGFAGNGLCANECPEGYTTDPGATSISDCYRECPAGHFEEFIETESMIVCTRCPLGTYASKGSSACDVCNGGRTTRGAASASVHACVCPEQHMLVRESDSVSSFTSSQVDAFTRGEVPIPDTADATGSLICKRCMEGMDCQKQVVLEGYYGRASPPDEACTTAGCTFFRKGEKTKSLENGIWYEIGDIPDIFRCVTKQDCPGAGLTSCSAGRIGLACGDCEPNHYPSADGVGCLECTRGGNVGIVLLVVLAFVGSIVAYFAATRPRSPRSAALVLPLSVFSIFITTMQILAVFDNLAIEWTVRTECGRTQCGRS